jgi:2-keto-4-pentenoate hydratase/2-oxohepta-3-ene-1,7-dioic acid hydratase in catechol pathway
MKIANFSKEGRPSFGVVTGDRIIDLTSRTGAATLADAIAAGTVMGAANAALNEKDGRLLSELKFLPPIAASSKMICIGLNYRDHAVEAGLKLPEHPSVFLRLHNSLTPHGGPLVRPRLSGDLDYEGELAVVIGKAGRHIAKSAALDHVFGYTCFNDGSLRDFQFKHCLIVGKNFASTGGIGPWIATTEAIPDPSTLTLTTRINGTQVQHKGTQDMIFDVPAIVAYVSSWTELVPGDVIATGTPEGVGLGRKPPLWLKPGDTIEVEISDIGILRNLVVSE